MKKRKKERRTREREEKTSKWIRSGSTTIQYFIDFYRIVITYTHTCRLLLLYYQQPCTTFNDLRNQGRFRTEHLSFFLSIPSTYAYTHIHICTDVVYVYIQVGEKERGRKKTRRKNRSIYVHRNRPCMCVCVYVWIGDPRLFCSRFFSLSQLPWTNRQAAAVAAASLNVVNLGRATFVRLLVLYINRSFFLRCNTLDVQ